MRKPAAFAALVIATLAVGLQANAAPVVYDLDTSTGGLFGAEADCTNVILTFNTLDCTYGAYRLPENFGFWQGPASNGGFFNKSGTGSLVTYDPANTANNAANEVTVPFLAGSTMTLEDNGTACDTDDKISATWIFGPAARNVATGNGRTAVETWDRVTHVMAATTVTKATPNGSSGCDYEISVPVAGVAGAPSFPPRICAAANSSDCYPTPNAPSGLGAPDFWAGASLTPPPNKTVTTGIERSPTNGANTAAKTTGTVTNWTCVANIPGSGDCVATASAGPSPILWGVNPTGGPTPGTQARAPGFDNVVLKFSTDNSGAQTKLKNGFAYYTREFRVNLGTSPPGQDNSWQGGAFAFTGTGPFLSGAPTARDDGPYTVKFNTANNPLDILVNDTGFSDPVTVSLVTPPVHGTVTITGSPGAKASIAVKYAPQVGFTGSDPFNYKIDDGAFNGTAHVDITVLDKIPVAVPGDAGTTFGGAPITKDVTSIPGVNLGDAPSTVGLNPAGDSNANCSLSGTVITVTPISAVFTGTASCGYTITDTDGESASSVVNANAIGRQPVAADDIANTVVNTPTAPIDVLKNDTLGNGTPAQNVISLPVAGGGALDGSCAIVDQKIVYTPDSKFSGEDSCRYVLTDSVGLISTATVSIRIDVALPGGGSSLDALSLGALLAGVPIAVRRRRRS